MDVIARRRIPVPAERVAAYAFDWRHDHEWTKGIREAVLTAEAPGGGFREGAEVTRTAYFLGRRIDYVLRVERLDGATLDMRSVAGPFPMHVTYRFAPDGDGTAASIRVRGGKGLMGLLGGPMVKANLRKDLRDLERRLAG